MTNVWFLSNDFLFKQSLSFIHNQDTKWSKDRCVLSYSLWMYHRLMLYILVNTHSFKHQRNNIHSTGLILAKSDKTLQTFNWTTEQSEQTIREGEDKTLKREEKHTKGKVMGASSHGAPHNASRQTLSLFWSSPSWTPALQAPLSRLI